MGQMIVCHVDGEFHKYSSPLIYVGYGVSDIQSRPSQHANPYLFTCTNPEDALDLYHEYRVCRADLEAYAILQFTLSMSKMPWVLMRKQWNQSLMQ